MKSEVTPTASFIDDLGADSLDTVELVMALEEGFGMEIPDEDAEKITTVKDAIKYIEAHLRNPSPCLQPYTRFILEKRRVVVTGVGLVTALGTGTEETWKGLCEGRSGVSTITRFDSTQFSTRIAAEVKDFDPLQWFEKKDLKKMDFFIHYAVAAADFAMKQSGLTITPGTVRARRASLSVPGSADSRSSSGNTRRCSKAVRARSLRSLFRPASSILRPARCRFVLAPEARTPRPARRAHRALTPSAMRFA